MDSLKKKMSSVIGLISNLAYVKTDRSGQYGQWRILGFSNKLSTFITKDGMTDNNGKRNDSVIFTKDHTSVNQVGPALEILDCEEDEKGEVTNNVYLAIPSLNRDGELDLNPVFEEDKTIESIEYLTGYPVQYDFDHIVNNWDYFYSVCHEITDEKGKTQKYYEGVVIDMHGRIVAKTSKQYKELHFWKELGFITGKNGNSEDVIARDASIQLENLKQIEWIDKIIHNGFGYIEDFVEVICEAKDQNNKEVIFSSCQRNGIVTAMLNPRYADIIGSIRRNFALKSAAAIGEKSDAKKLELKK